MSGCRSSLSWAGIVCTKGSVGRPGHRPLASLPLTMSTLSPSCRLSLPVIRDAASSRDCFRRQIPLVVNRVRGPAALTIRVSVA